MILNLLLMMHLVAARSLPRRQQIMDKNWIVTRRETDLSLSSNYDDNTASEVSQFQTELANLSIPSYLKDLYINLTHSNGVARPSLNSEEFKINTIQSYKNQAKSKPTSMVSYIQLLVHICIVI